MENQRNQPQKFFTSDLHFGHFNIISYTGRPYDSVEQMDHDLVQRWNRVVAPADTTYVLGDLAMGDRNVTRLNRIAESLNGVKLLVPGNHDSCHPSYPRFEERRSDYLPGFEILDEQVWINIADHRVLLCHFPPDGDHTATDRYRTYRPQVDDNQWVLHGHTHGLYRQRGRWIDVGVDSFGGAPVSESDIAQLMAQGPQNRHVLPWSLSSKSPRSSASS